MTTLQLDIALESTTIKGEYLAPTLRRSSAQIAVCLHPWGWLGGSMQDPVLDLLLKPLQANGYHTIRYNSRGVGGSSGWPSFTGFTEGKDLEAVVDWSIKYVESLPGKFQVNAVTIIGYSHGSLIATLFPVLRNPQIKTSYILISYPLGPRSYLTLFRSSTYTKKLHDIICSASSDILIFYGDQDEFTSRNNYVGWVTELVKLRKEVTQPGSVEQGPRPVEHPGLTVAYRPGASHFWRGRDGIWLADTIEKWLSSPGV